MGTLTIDLVTLETVSLSFTLQVEGSEWWRRRENKGLGKSVGKAVPHCVAALWGQGPGRHLGYVSASEDSVMVVPACSTSSDFSVNTEALI